MENLALGRNFISADKKMAIDSYGKTFVVGGVVGHTGAINESAKILSFNVDEKYNEVTAITTKGSAHIDFLFNI